MITPEEVRQQLAKILESPWFAKRSAQKVVLEYYIKHYLANRNVTGEMAQTYMDAHKLDLPRNKQTISNARESLAAYYAEHPNDDVYIQLSSFPYRIEVTDRRTQRPVELHYLDEIDRKAKMSRERAVLGYYRLQSETLRPQLDNYEIIVNGTRRRETALFTSEDRVGMSLDPSTISFSLSATPLPLISSALKSAGEEAYGLLSSQGVVLRNDPTYRLLDASFSGQFSLRFSTETFFGYRLTCGLMEDELHKNLIRHDCDIDALLRESANEFPVRQEILPNLKSLTEFRHRFCAGGPGVLFALARPNGYGNQPDFLLPIQIRSKMTADGRGMLGVIPKAVHQPVVGDPQEMRIEQTVYREVFEEVFNRQEQPPENALYNWYMDEEPGLKYFREHPESFHLRVAAFGISALSGNFEFACTLAIEDEAYYAQFETKMAFRNWEWSSWIPLSSKDEIGITDLLLNPEFATESCFHLAEGLLCLEALSPARVKLPIIERRLKPLV